MRYKLAEGTPDALAIYCADPRFQMAFRQFLNKELNIQMPMIITVPGVSSHFGVRGMLPKNWHGLSESIATMAHVHPVSRVILINHDDCKGYAKIAGWLGGILNVSKMQRQHAKELAEYIRKQYLPNAQFEIYQAHIVDSNEVEFEKVV